MQNYGDERSNKKVVKGTPENWNNMDKKQKTKWRLTHRIVKDGEEFKEEEVKLNEKEMSATEETKID